ncbi:MAG: molybdopterin-guanine dinucleotide biosynthesis protein MobB, partial [Eubacteriales bacterium]|nr:molybdopterin-guanine dinucleotide biosynthesis protein MobB [Eubacteriales bacterium]
LGHLNCVVVETSGEHIPDQWFLNVNTPEVYGRLDQAAQPVLAVSGSKNTGKTWLLEHLVSILAGAGVRAAVIKHDGHEFEADVPGTDSHRMKKAGIRRVGKVHPCRIQRSARLYPDFRAQNRQRSYGRTDRGNRPCVRNGFNYRTVFRDKPPQ